MRLGKGVIALVVLLLGLSAGCSPQEKAATGYDPADVAVINRILRDNDAQNGFLASLGWKIDQPDTWLAFTDETQEPPERIRLAWINRKLDVLEFCNARLTGVMDLTGLTTPRTVQFYANDLEEVKGLEAMTKLETLWVAHSRVHSLGDLSGLIYLRDLIILANRLTTVGDLSGLTHLVRLDASFNRELTSLGDLSKLTRMRQLNVAVNKLTTLGDLSAMKDLYSLDVSYNRLTDLGDLGGLLRLTELNASINGLQNLRRLDNLVNLKRLNLRQNRLADIGDLSRLTALECVDVGFNRLTTLGDLKGLTRLTHLGVGHNQLTDLGELGADDTLEELVLSHNQLTALPDLTGMKALKKLVVADNPLEQPDPMKRLPEGVLEDFAFSGDQFPELSLAAKPLESLNELEVRKSDRMRDWELLRRMVANKPADFKWGPVVDAKIKQGPPPRLLQRLDLYGRPLKTLNLADHVAVDLIDNPGPVDRLVIGDGGYTLTELVQLHRKLRPAILDVISSQHPLLGDLKKPLKAGTAYTLKQLSPRLAADYQAAGDTVTLVACDKSGGFFFWTDDSLRDEFLKAKTELNEIRAVDAYTFENGRITFNRPGEYRLVVASDYIDGFESPVFVAYEDVLRVE